MKKSELDPTLIPNAKKRFLIAEDEGTDILRITLPGSFDFPDAHIYLYYGPEEAAYDTLIEKGITEEDPYFHLLKVKLALEIRREIKNHRDITEQRRQKARQLQDIASFTIHQSVDPKE